VSYAFAAIVEEEDVDETWVPRIIDKVGTVAWNDDDGEIYGFRASGLTVYRGDISKQARLLRLEDVDIFVSISQARIVAVCKKYDTGGGWIGGLGAMIVLNTVSKARAAMRSHGKFLVGQLRWPWLNLVGYTEKTGWLSSNQIRLSCQDGETDSWIYIDFELPKRDKPRQIAEYILRVAAEARASYPYLSAEESQQLQEASLPDHVADEKQFATAKLPGTRKVKESTAYPASAEPQTDPTVIPQPDTAPPEPTAVLPEPQPTIADAGALTEPRPAPRPATALSAPVVLPPAPGAAADPESPVALETGAEAPALPVATGVRARCSDCGRPAVPDARFCRACGAAVEVVAEEPDPEPEPEPESIEAAVQECASCGAAAAPDARFCRACGAPVEIAAEDPAPGMGPGPVSMDAASVTRPNVAPIAKPVAGRAQPPQRPPAAPARSRADGRGKRLVVLAALLAFAAGGIAAVVIVTTGGGGEEPKPAAASDFAAEESDADLPTPEAPEEDSELDAAPVESASGVLESGRYVRLASFRYDTAAEKEATRLHGEGLREAQVASSNEVEGMAPAFWVVLAGPVSTRGEERGVIRAAKRAGIRDAFAAELAPATAGIAPADLVGDFSGQLAQSDPEVKRLNKDILTRMSFYDDGEQATVEYRRPNCTGSLSFLGTAGPVLTYEESISAGKCADGGIWHLKLDGDDLQATWWRDDDVTFVRGSLSP
jgi:hypothetical protein